MKIATVVGARPQFIKAAPVSSAMTAAGLDEHMIHTGQHFDDRMAAIFFREFGMKAPAHSLGISGGPHGQMTGRMLEAVEAALVEIEPDVVLVYGDTNSTLAGALAAAKLGLPVAHVEAGLRSYRQSMPEEINRTVTDHVSSILFCPTETAVENLLREGIGGDANGTESRRDESPLVLNVGDVMVDALNDTLKRCESHDADYGLEPKSYALLTLHRAESTVGKDTLERLVDSICELADTMPVLFPVHPRTARALELAGLLPRLETHPNLMLTEPMDHVSFISAQGKARVVVTDSGGAQKEACILGVPCLTIRDETEWVETVASGWNTLLGCPPRDLAERALAVCAPGGSGGDLFGNGHTAKRIVDVLKGFEKNASPVRITSAG